MTCRPFIHLFWRGCCGIALPRLLLLLLLPTAAHAEKPIWNRPEAYLGETPPGDRPVLFAGGRLAPTNYWAGSRVAFTEDGRQFLYGMNTTWFDGKNQKFMSFRFDGTSWQGPTVVFPAYSMPTLSSDRTALYLTGNDGAIYVTKPAGTGWTPPVEFLRRDYSLYNLMPTRSGRFYVGSNGTWGKRGDNSSWRFSVLAGIGTGTGADTGITSLGEPLNSPGFNGDFYVSPDESYLILSAKESPTFESELWLSFRQADGKWTAPVSLGPVINDGLAHRWGAYVSPDGKYLFYTKGTTERDCGIYWVRFDGLLKRLRQQALGPKS